MTAFAIISTSLALLTLVLGFLAVRNAYDSARCGVGDRVAGELKRIRDEDASLAESLADQLVRGGSLPEVVADYQARRRRLLPAAAAGQSGPSLWGEHELTAYKDGSIGDALAAAWRAYLYRSALLMTAIVFGAGLSNATAYFFWSARPDAAATRGAVTEDPRPRP